MAKDAKNPLNEDSPPEPDSTQTATATVEPEPGAVQDELSLEDYLPTPGEGKTEPPKDEQATEPEGETEPEPEPEKPKEPEPKVEPQPKMYPYKGENLTLEQLQERGLIEDALTTAEQHKHLQHKYQELLEREATRQREVETKPQQAEQTREVPAEQIVAHYQPQFQQVVDKGYIESDFVELHPRLTANMLMHRDLLYGVQKQVSEIVQHLNGRIQTDQATSARSTLDGAIDGVIAVGSSDKENGVLFEPLKDPEVRKGFSDYLIELNPAVSQLTSEFVRRQYFAYNHEIFADLKRAQKTERTPKAQVRAEGPSARGGLPPKPDEEDELGLDQVLG
jgi:hypothetical protein